MPNRTIKTPADTAFQNCDCLDSITVSSITCAASSATMDGVPECSADRTHPKRLRYQRCATPRPSRFITLKPPTIHAAPSAAAPIVSTGPNGLFSAHSNGKATNTIKAIFNIGVRISWWQRDSASPHPLRSFPSS